MLIVAIALFVAIDTEHLWYDSVGFGEVFTTKLVTRLALFGGFGLFMAAMTFGNVYLAYRLRPAFGPRRSSR